MTTITIVTHVEAPGGVEDDRCLASALRASGADVRLAAWSGPAVDWSTDQVTVIRSTWDYHLHLAAWFDWLETASRRTRLVNPAGLVRWNNDKAYLLDLAAQAVAIVPTVLLTGSTDLASASAARGWTDVVIKPTVGASAHGVRRFRGAAIGAQGAAHASAMIAATGKALLQPYQPAVDSERERSLVYIDGLFRHAFSKPPFYASVGEAALARHEATGAERILAERVLAALPSRPVFARIDLLPSASGPLVMEAELVEP